jgi:SH3-like domain-containing protein
VIRILVLALLAALIASPAGAAHYASLRGDKVYLREGPTFRHRVLFVYRRKDYPVEVIAAYESWRRVRDADGTVGWVNQTMLSDARFALVIGHVRAALRKSADGNAAALAFAEPGVVARLKACKPQFCEVVADGLTGWIDRTRIWGADTGEVFN